MVETKLESLEYLIRHRAIFTELKLNKIGMEENAICKVCQEEDKVFLHLFLYCKELQEFHEKCKCLTNDLRRDESEQEMEWNRVVILGWNGKCKNKKSDKSVPNVDQKCNMGKENYGKEGEKKLIYGVSSKESQKNT